jgi:SecD/SecF fusion protein
MDKYFKWKVLLIVVATGLCIWWAYPPKEKIRLGLDLQGGMQLLLQVDMEKIPKEAQEDATERVVEIIRNRIDEFGVREPTITRQGRDLVVVQLPGVTDRQRAKDIIGRSAFLEFQLVSDDSELIKQAEEGKVPEGYEYLEIKEATGSTFILLTEKAVITGEHLTTASVGFDQYGQPIVQLQFDKDGARIFDQVTFQNVGKRLAIVLDGRVYSAPVIRDRIPNGQAQISGSFSAAEASDLALVLRAGALPAPVNIIEERTVGPSLGRDSIHSGIRAALAGAAFVVLFMPLYYLIAGFIADIGLLFYVILVIGVFSALQTSLTLPGIAGFILSVGMAVDANVLIFERIREEVNAGKTARAAVSAGYHKAFSAILDSNVTTLITSIILFFMGTGPVKGFAVTLTIGILASMFSAILITRVIFDFLLSRNPNLQFKMFQLFRNPNIPFLKGRFLAYGFSAIVLVIGIASFVVRGRENFGVEFTGGTLVQLEFQSAVEIGTLRSALQKEGMKGLMIQHYGDPGQNEFIIKTSESDVGKIEKVASEIAGAGGYQVERVDQVGPSVSQDLQKKALWAVFWSAVGILFYLGWRFKWKYALAAVVALFHDTLFSFGVYALSGREINLATVAAILTIMGFSVNDTIITFDRVRDNLKVMRKMSFSDIVTTSINQTLSRTIITSGTALLSIIALFLFGGAAINDFAFVLLIGFTVGIYSTIFVATALAVDWKAH